MKKYREKFLLKLIFVLLVLLSCSNPHGSNEEDVRAGFFASPTEVEVGKPVSFVNTSSHATDYVWTFGDGNTSTEKNPTHIFTQQGEYTITLQANSADESDVLSLDKHIKVVSASDTSRLNFTASITSGNAPLTVNFSCGNPERFNSVTWRFGDNSTSNLHNPTHTFQLPGLYDVTLIGRGQNGIEETVTKNNFIVVHGAPQADFSAAVTTGIVPKNIVFIDHSTGDITSWFWDFGDGNTSTERNPSHTYLQSGHYTVTLTVTGPTGSNTQIKQDFIALDEVYTISIPSLGPFFPAKIGGDCDFARHGPRVSTKATVEIVGNRSQLILYMFAQETRRDHSTAEGEWLVPLDSYVPTGVEVKGINSPEFAEHGYVDTNHLYDYSPIFPLGRFKTMGDTPGDDICNTTLDDAHMFFENIRIELLIRR